MGRARRKRKFGTTEKRMLTGCSMLAVSAVLTVLSGQSPGMAEWYSTHIYPVIVSVVGRGSGLFTCSLAALCLYVLVLLTVGSLIPVSYTHLLLLSNEGCIHCETCTYPDAPCRMPGTLTPAVEGFGINVQRLSKTAKVRYINGSNTVTYFGLLLF